MKSILEHTTLFAFLIAGSALLAGCSKEEGIDFDDIDSTVGVTLHEFKLPGNNSTREIALNDLLDIDANGCVKIDEVTGQYVFRQDGNDVSPTTTSVAPVCLEAPNSGISNHRFVIPGSSLATARRASRKAMSMTQTVNTFNFETTHNSDVAWLYGARTSSDISLLVTFSNDLKAVVGKIQGINIQFPTFMKLSNIVCNQQHFDADEVFNNGNLLPLNDINPSTGNLKLTATIDTLIFSERGHEGDSQHLYCNSSVINMQGDITFSIDIDNAAANINSDALYAIALEGRTPDFYLDSSLQLSDFHILNATGNFTPTISLDNVGDVTVNDVPDFLNDPEVNIVLDNPVIHLVVESDLGVDGIINGVLVSFMSDGTQRDLHIDNIRIRKNTTSDIIICAYDNGQFTGNETQIIETGDGIRNLIDRIPEHITFSCTAYSDPDDTGYIELGRSYHIKPAYTVEAPLALNSGSVIVYTDSFDGWNGDLDDMELRDDAAITLKTKATNGSPLDLKLSAHAIGLASDNGQQPDLSDYFSVDVTTNKSGNMITSALNDPTPTELTIVMKQKKNNAFKLLDGISFKAVGTSQTDATTLNSGEGKDATTQTLKLDNISISLNGTIIISNDDDDKKK